MLLTALLVLLCCNYYAVAQVAHPDPKRSWLSFDETTVDDLLKQFPMVSESTVKRFYDIYGGRSSVKLIEMFAEWKSEHKLPAVATDTERWNLAVQQAFIYLTKPANVRKNKAEPTTLPKAQVIYETNHTDHHGHHVLLILPMRMDLALDDAVAFFTDAIAGYLQSYLADKPPETQVTLMCDIRAGRGHPEWANPPLTKTIPAVEAIAKGLIHLHPEQIHLALLYPIPMFGKSIFKMAKPLLGHELTDLIIVIESDEGASRHAPPPKKALMDYVDDATVEDLEEFRHDLYHPKD